MKEIYFGKIALDIKINFSSQAILNTNVWKVPKKNSEKRTFWYIPERFGSLWNVPLKFVFP